MTERGNLPGAATVLDAAIDRASGVDVGEVRGLLKHQRASVDFLRGDYERSIRLAYEAITELQSPSARDRALGDLAAAFAELGCRSAARDAHLILAATAQAQYIRWMATINLMELAALDMREPNFEQHRRELVDAPLPPSLEATYHLYVGQGFERFGKHDLAVQAVEHALQIAETHKLSRLYFEVEAALQALKAGKVPAVPAVVAPAVSVVDIADELHRMRKVAVAADY
jgi:tetratricopeptide (TPR) repeat protein